MTEPQRQLESILVADCGSTMTKVVLLDIVEGTYRFVAHAAARSTADSTWDDVWVGVVDAIAQLQVVSGRTFLNGSKLIVPESADGKGVDCFLAVSSAAEPLRVVLVGLARDTSLASLQRAARSTYTQIVETIALDMAGPESPLRSDSERISAIWRAAPDTICLAGGTDGGATTPVLDMVRNVVRVALFLLGDNRPQVIYAGNEQLRAAVTELLTEVVEPQMVDNVRPTVEAENVGPAAEEIELGFYEQKVRHLAGIEMLGEWSRAPVLPTARAADYTIRYCDRVFQPDKPALSLDIGSASVIINACRNGRPSTVVRSDLGVGHGLSQLLEQIEMRDLLRWLPFELAEHEARNRLMNKALQPHSIPQTQEDLLLEQAAAREAVRLAVHDLGWLKEKDGLVPACNPLVLGGGMLAHAPNYGQAALVGLDALQPVGISELYLDEYDLLPALGAAASLQPLAMVQTLANGGLTFLGTLVALTGSLDGGARALTIHIAGQETPVEVASGSLALIPLPPGSADAPLELVPARGVDLGVGPGKGVKLAARGGALGLIVDARGRPLPFALDPSVQRQRLGRWLMQMTSA